ncbi:TRIC cation channel family protein [Corynebacterium sp. CCM 8862]|uniref:TRIC cation channel family protein n=1 Tax=Corynebacterium mendelii TaxID=2765362 RepID=A0A939DZS2_9CORY|nr:TRIC cation channel family protein [Corynebacterium mendelii]
MQGVDPTILALYKILDLIGVVLNGAIGGTIARQRNFDIIGFVFLAIFSALAGGMIRDTLMQRGTPAAIAQPSYMGFAILGALLALAVNLKGRKWELFKVHGDAVILGVWTVTGSIKALTYGMPAASAVFMGVLTAVGGGMIRDIAIGTIPSVFGGNTLYATPAITGAATMVVFHMMGLDAVGMIMGTVVGAGFAITAYWRGWVLPMNSEFAPVNMTAAQLRRMLKQAENKGRRAGLEAGATQGIAAGIARGAKIGSLRQRRRWRKELKKGELTRSELDRIIAQRLDQAHNPTTSPLSPAQGDPRTCDATGNIPDPDPGSGPDNRGNDTGRR